MLMMDRQVACLCIHVGIRSRKVLTTWCTCQRDFRHIFASSGSGAAGSGAKRGMNFGGCMTPAAQPVQREWRYAEQPMGSQGMPATPPRQQGGVATISGGAAAAGGSSGMGSPRTPARALAASLRGGGGSAAASPGGLRSPGGGGPPPAHSPGSMRPPPGACFKCMQEGHWSRDCPTPHASGGGGGAGGAASGGEGGGRRLPASLASPPRGSQEVRQNILLSPLAHDLADTSHPAQCVAVAEGCC